MVSPFLRGNGREARVIDILVQSLLLGRDHDRELFRSAENSRNGYLLTAGGIIQRHPSLAAAVWLSVGVL